MTIPGTEFMLDRRQGAPPPTTPRDKGTEGNMHWRNGSWWNEPEFSAHTIPSRLPPDIAAQTTLPRWQSSSQRVTLYRPIFLSTMPIHWRSSSLSLLPLHLSAQVPNISLEVPLLFPAPSYLKSLVRHLITGLMYTFLGRPTLSNKTSRWKG